MFKTQIVRSETFSRNGNEWVRAEITCAFDKEKCDVEFSAESFDKLKKENYDRVCHRHAVKNK